MCKTVYQCFIIIANFSTNQLTVLTVELSCDWWSKIVNFQHCFIFFRRDQILGDLKKEGVNCGGCGPETIRLRPALIFEPKHANIFLEKLNGVLATY